VFGTLLDDPLWDYTVCHARSMVVHVAQALLTAFRWHQKDPGVVLAVSNALHWAVVASAECRVIVSSELDLLLTSCAHMVDVDPAQSDALWGLLRVLMDTAPDVRCRVLDHKLFAFLVDGLATHHSQHDGVPFSMLRDPSDLLCAACLRGHTALSKTCMARCSTLGFTRGKVRKTPRSILSATSSSASRIARDAPGAL
jgi:hypothetical protein